MRLNKLVIRGFKAFADRTEIVFNDDFTAIVGPNGCGKSNVSDAIKWTLAETRPKQLRAASGKMTEVIFIGTEKRPGMSYAEVSLYFDNTKRDLFKQLDYDEVVITRKIDKSGTSEYFINNNKCQQKDINAMLHNTGIGKNGYSIIHQGKVAEICRAKASERRVMFEEVADISHFRIDKEKAEENLKETQIKLDTMQEVINEMEGRRAPLQKQAEKAQKSEELKKEIKELELNLLISKTESMQDTKAMFDKKINTLTIKIMNAEDEYNKLVKQEDDFHNETFKLDRELNVIQNKILEESVKSTKDTGDMNLLKQKLEDSANNIDRISNELENLNAKKDTVLSQIKQQTNSYEEHKSEQNIKDAEYKEKSIKYNMFNKDSDEKNSLIKSLSTEFIELQQKKEVLDRELQSVKVSNAVNESKVKQLNEYISEHEEKLKTILLDIETADKERRSFYNKKIDESNSYNEVTQNRNNIKAEIEDLRNEITQLSSVLSGQQTKLEVLTDNKSKLGIFNEATQLLLKDKTLPQLKDKLYGTLVDLLNVPAKFATAIEYSVGGAYQHIVVQTADDATYLINYLKEKKYGRVTFRPLSTTKVRPKVPEILSAKKEHGVLGIASELVECDAKFKNLVEFLLGNTLIVDNSNTGKYLFTQFNQAFKIATLDGDIFARGGEISGGFTKNATKVFSQQKDIDDAKNTIEQTRIAIQQAKELVTQKQSEVQDLAVILEERKSRLVEFRENEVAAESKLVALNEKKEEINVLVTKAKEELSQITFGSSEVQAKLDEQKRLENLITKKKMEYEEVSKARSTDADGDEISNLEKQVLDLKVYLATLGQSIITEEQEIARLNIELKTIDADIDSRNADLTNFNQIIAEIKEKTENIKVVGQSKEIIDELEVQKKTIELRKEYILNEQKTINDKKAHLIDEKNNDNEKKYREENARDKFLEELNELREYILSTYNETYETALEYKIEGFQAYGSKEKIKDLKARKSRLGEVNELAIEELRELEERYADKCEKRDDIQQSCDDIKSLISELTAQMRDKFVETFNKVRENYQETFTKLFMGGRGDLELDYSKTDDPLLADIIIKAKPPGKKEMDIGLYSGGEQTLISIALLFSFISLKPMPFCLLDEADSALDEPNCDLYARFINKFAESGSQFIVITHRRQSMQCANSIFGVTMQEKGVSKVVSIQLEDAVELGGK